MKLIKPDLNVLLTAAHRRWIETRDPKDGDRFAALVAEMTLNPRPQSPQVTESVDQKE